MSYLICPVCGRKFTPPDRVQPTALPGSEAQVVYCSTTCKKKRNNKNYYARYREKVIAKNNERQKRKRGTLD